MEESKPREKVLKKIRNALIHKTNAPFPLVDKDSGLYILNEESAAVCFAEQWVKNGGNFIFCEDRFDFAEQVVQLAEQKKWKNTSCPEEELNGFLVDCEIPFGVLPGVLEDTDCLITSCECLVSRTGSVLVSSKQAGGRRLPFIANSHIVIGYLDQLVPDIKDALLLMKAKYPKALPSLMTFISGPSKTADIELIEVTGAHGPANVFVFLIEKDIV